MSEQLPPPQAPDSTGSTAAEPVQVRAPAPKASGINKKVLATCLGVVGLALAVSFYLGFGSTKPQDQDIKLPQEQSDAAPATVAKPEGLVGLRNQNYAQVTAPPPEPPPLPSPTPPPNGPPDLVLRKAPPDYARMQAPVQSAPPSKAQLAKEEREKRAQQAAQSGLFFTRKQAAVASPTPTGAGVAQAGFAPGQAEAIQPQDVPASYVQNLQGRKDDFRTIAGTNPYLMEPYLEPQSPYELKAGAIIPAALKTAINSDLPGDVTAQVTENVFDSATGRYLLIPQGTTMYGRYDSAIAYGQSRLLVIWQRLIMPDGRSIRVDNMVGTDALGRSGVEDRVNNHWGRVLVGVILSTAISVGAEIATNDDNSSVLDSRSIGESTADAAAQEAIRVGSQITERNLNIQPTIEIRPGALIKALVNKDMILAPYGGAS